MIEIKGNNEEVVQEIEIKENNEIIRLECLKYNGSVKCCSETLRIFNEIDKKNLKTENISRIIYKNCLNIQGSNPLACTHAYKAAIKVIYF